MTVKKSASKKMATSKKVGIGAAVAAGAAALALGGYYFYGPKGKQNRKALKGWALKAQKDVLVKAKKMKNMSEPMYHKLVDSVMAKYRDLKTSSPAEIAALAVELKSMWKGMQKKAMPKKARVAKKKMVKKLAKKKKR